MIRVLLTSLLALSACAPEDHDHEGPPAATPSPSAGVEAPAPPTPMGELHVTPDLARDLRVSLATVGAERGVERVDLLGEVVIAEDARAIVASPLPARVVRVPVATGQAVEAGRVLVELESVELGRARAALLAARAEALRAEQSLARKRELTEVVSRAELEAAEAEAAVAAAELAAAEAALRALGVGTALPTPVDGRFTLRAPLAGVVLERDIALGQAVEAQAPLLRLADTRRLQVEAHAFERDAVRIPAGGHADVRLSALPAEERPATVALIGGEVERSSRTIPVRLDLAPDPKLRPGMAATATVALLATPAPVVTVPAAALQRFAGGWVVFVPREEAVYEIRAVGRGRDIGAEVEILSGLAPGERVVLDGAFLLKAEAEKRQGGGEGHHDH